MKLGILNQKNLWPTLIYQFEHSGTPYFRGPLVLKTNNSCRTHSYILRLKKCCLTTFFRCKPHSIRLLEKDPFLALSFLSLPLFPFAICQRHSVSVLLCVFYCIDEIVFFIQEYLPLVWLRLGLART